MHILYKKNNSKRISNKKNKRKKLEKNKIRKKSAVMLSLDWLRPYLSLKKLAKSALYQEFFGVISIGYSDQHLSLERNAEPLPTININFKAIIFLKIQSTINFGMEGHKYSSITINYSDRNYNLVKA